MNLLCGVLGVIATFYSRLDLAFYLMLLAAVFDFCDGLSARLLGAYSDMGKELDSLSDDISFGALPAIMLFWTSVQLGGGGSCYLFSNISLWSLFPVMIAVFSGLRLAKFNVDERQTTSFIGLATPACAMICGSLAYLVSAMPDCFLARWCAGPVFIPVLSVALSALLVSEIPMFSMKFHKGMKMDATNIMRIVFVCFVVAALVVVLCFRINWSAAVLVGFVGYVVMNIIAALFPTK